MSAFVLTTSLASASNHLLRTKPHLATRPCLMQPCTPKTTITLSSPSPPPPPSPNPSPPTANTTSSIPSPKWACMPHCGACCKLDDYDIDVLRTMLKNESDVIDYLSMVSPTGWCIHFDSQSRRCTCYDTRPRFCRATPTVFQQLYDVPEPQFDEFAISCCTFHIGNTYGEDSNEALRYDTFSNAPPSSSQQTP